jgi:hypothetical protein
MEWHWAQYRIPERVAVCEEDADHFRIAVGGKAKLSWVSMGVAADGPPAPGF